MFRRNKNRQVNSPKRPMQKIRRLRSESLENRSLMAGNVFAGLEGSLLVVTGDDLGNDIAITQAANGNVSVVGRNGTTINGVGSVTFANPQLQQADIRLFGGNDIATIRNLRVTNDLGVDLGQGDDRLTLAGARSGASMSIYGEAGADRLTASGLTVGTDLNVEMGIGAAVVSLATSSIGENLHVNTDEANDNIRLTDLVMGGDLSIESKAGNDVVTALRTQSKTLTANTDAGIDNVRLESVTTLEDINVATGVGNDRVTLLNVNSSKGVAVSVDEGNDAVVATNVVAATDAIFTGGAGVDSFDDNGIFASKVEIKEFETFL